MGLLSLRFLQARRGLLTRLKSELGFKAAYREVIEWKSKCPLETLCGFDFHSLWDGSKRDDPRRLDRQPGRLPRVPAADDRAGFAPAGLL